MSKNNKKRNCPANGKTISSADCGSNRHSTYHCPTTCPFSPYHIDNYDQFLKIEKRVDQALLDHAFDDPDLSPRLKKINNTHEHSSLQTSGFFSSLLFFEKDNDGLSFAEKHAQTNSHKLKNDDAVLIKNRAHIKASLIEIQSVIDEKTVTYIDLLDPSSKPSLILDRGLAGMACRFQRFFTITYPTPGYTRIHEALTEIIDLGGDSVTHAFQTIIEHLGGENTPLWLGSNYSKIVQALISVQHARFRSKLQVTDYKTLTLNYQFKGSLAPLYKRLEKAGCILDNLTENEQEFQRVYLWPDRGPKDAYQQSLGGTHYLGSIFIKPGFIRIIAEDTEELAAFQDQFEKAAGKKATLSSELVQDHAAHEATQVSDIDEALVPPSLLQITHGIKPSTSKMPIIEDGDDAPPPVNEIINTYYKKLLDETIPELNNHTPRQAASDFMQRPQLIEWAKKLIALIDKQNLATESDADIDWVLTELDLNEIIQPRPPKRAPYPTQYEQHFEDEEDDEWERAIDEERGIEITVCDARIQEKLEQYPTATSVLDAMEKQGCTLIDDAYSVGVINDETFHMIVPLLISAWLAVLDEDTPISWSPSLFHDCMNQVLIETKRSIEKDESLADNLERICCDTPLFTLLGEYWEDVVATLPQKQRPDLEQEAQVHIYFIAAINALTSSIIDTK